MTAIRLMAMRVRVALAVLLAFAAMFGVARSVGAQEPGPGEASIYFIAFACPDEGADPYVDCDILDGASFSIEAGGVELAGSPFATGLTSLVPGFQFIAPEGATLTITELTGNPAGYTPAPGFDPLVINVADIPEVGCGGESTCPGIEFINTPFAVADGPADDTEIADDTVLPNTGVGSAPGSLPATALFIAGIVMMLGTGALKVRRKPVR